MTTTALRRPAARTTTRALSRRVAVIIIGGLLTGLIAGHLAARGREIDIVGLIAVLIPVALWKRPQFAPVVLMTSALLIEQVGQSVEVTGANSPGAGIVALTQSIPITSSIPWFQGIGSLHIEPADLLMLTLLVIYMWTCTEWGPRWWPRSHITAGVLALVGMVFIGLLLGESHHGNLRVSLQESRPYVYLASAYFLTAAMIRSRSALRAMLWVIVLAETVKSIQGIYVYFETINWNPRPQAVLGHEEAYFFGLYMLLVAALWIFGVPGRLRKTATWLLPLVIMADLANNRRAAWLVLGGGLITLMVVGYEAMPERRRTIRRAAACVVFACALYLPGFWNSTGTFGQPARAIRSVITPDARDASSDLYRVEEDANLEYNIKQDGITGIGFGVPIDYALPITNIQGIDPDLKYIPHNGVLYVLMRIGLLGGIALWSLIGVGIVAGCRLARAPDREIAVVGALLAAALVGYALEGATDQGFYFYRIAIAVGCLLGLAEAARHILHGGGIRFVPDQ